MSTVILPHEPIYLAKQQQDNKLNYKTTITAVGFDKTASLFHSLTPYEKY
jgi:hypothetical protein